MDCSFSKYPTQCLEGRMPIPLRIFCVPSIQFGAGNTKVLSLRAIGAGRLLRDMYKELCERRGGQLCLKVNFGLNLKGDIGARWPVKRGQRGQRGQPGQMHVTLRSGVGLFIYTSSPEQSAELQTKKSNCSLTPSFGHHNEHLRYSIARPDLLVSFPWLPYPPALTIFLLL